MDPNACIVSTSTVPPQQRDWWAEEIFRSNKAICGLPSEIANKIVRHVEDFPLSLERAKDLQKELLQERKNHVDQLLNWDMSETDTDWPEEIWGKKR